MCVSLAGLHALKILSFITGTSICQDGTGDPILHRVSCILYHVVIMDNKVVITGTGLISSLGGSGAETWEALLSGKSGISSVKDFPSDGFKCRAAAQVRGLKPAELGIHPRDSRIMDRHSYMLLKATRDAYGDARLDSYTIAPENIGYFAAMGMVDYNIDDLLPSVLKSLNDEGNLDYDRFFSSAYQDIHPLWPLSMLNNINFCQVAIYLGIKGDNTTFSPHSDSGIHSIAEAYNSVLEKKADVVLAGGVSEKVSPLSIARASLSGTLNTDGASCSPFDKRRNGTVLGEGSGIVAVELLSSAEQRHVSCLAGISGYGASCGSERKNNCATTAAVSISMEAALAKADLKPAEIDLIIAHGDGTVTGDNNEAEAIHQTFAGHTDKLTVFSSKAALGHMLSGAAAADVVLGTYILKNGIIPAVSASISVEDSIKFNVLNKPLEKEVKRILINSQSYEGQCASLIIEAVT